MTKADKRYQDAVRSLGCIICQLFHLCYSPCEIHHRLTGGRRMGERFVLGLCFLHHRSGRCDEEVVSRDHNQRRFEARYGKEEWLQEKQDEAIGKYLPEMAI
jgi:hypothetical protein